MHVLWVTFILSKFANDTIIVGKASRDNLWAIKSVLNGFELASGLSANFHKRKILGVNVDLILLQETSNFVSCAISPLPFTFLGLPIGSNP